MFKVGDKVLRDIQYQREKPFYTECMVAGLDVNGPLEVVEVATSGHVRLRGLGGVWWNDERFGPYPIGPCRWSADHAESLRLAVVEADAELAKAVANYNRYVSSQPPQLEQIAYQPIGVKDASDTINSFSTGPAPIIPKRAADSK